MKLCFIAPGYRAVQVLSGDTSGSGGAESQMAYIAAEHASLGIEVHLIYGNGVSQPVRRLIEGIDCLEAFPNWRSPASVLRFLGALRATRANYFYANLPDDFLFIVVLARLDRSSEPCRMSP